MILSLTCSELTDLVMAQLAGRFPVGPQCSRITVTKAVKATLSWAEYCFGQIAVRYYSRDGEPYFNHLNGDQYAMFLYRLSRELYMAGEPDGAAMTYQLNKSYFGIDAFYEVVLPELFQFIHPIGTILGRARYGEGLVVYQGVSVGDHHGQKPVIGKWCVLHPKSTVLGDSRLGDHVRIGAGAMAINEAIPDRMVFTGIPGYHRITDNKLQNPYWKEEYIHE